MENRKIEFPTSTSTQDSTAKDENRAGIKRKARADQETEEESILQIQSKVEHEAENKANEAGEGATLRRQKHTECEAVRRASDENRTGIKRKACALETEEESALQIQSKVEYEAERKANETGEEVTLRRQKHTECEAGGRRAKEKEEVTDQTVRGHSSSKVSVEKKEEMVSLREVPAENRLKSRILSDDERKAIRLNRFAKDKPEAVVVCVDELSIEEQLFHFQGKRVTILTNPTRRVTDRRRLYSEEEDLGWDNWDLFDPFMLSFTLGLWGYIQPILYPDSADAPVLETIDLLKDLATLFYRGRFGDSTESLFPLAIEWTKASKHALCHYDIIYLLVNGHSCLSAMVVVANMIDRPDLRKTALMLLLSAGYTKRCILPVDVPSVFPFQESWAPITYK